MKIVSAQKKATLRVPTAAPSANARARAKYPNMHLVEVTKSATGSAGPGTQLDDYLSMGYKILVDHDGDPSLRTHRANILVGMPKEEYDQMVLDNDSIFAPEALRPAIDSSTVETTERMMTYSEMISKQPDDPASED